MSVCSASRLSFLRMDFKLRRISWGFLISTPLRTDSIVVGREHRKSQTTVYENAECCSMRGFWLQGGAAMSCGINALWRTWSFLASPNTDSFPPRAEFRVVPKDVLTTFVEDRLNTFLAATRLKWKSESADQFRVAEEVVQRESIFTSTYQTKCNGTGKRQHTHKTCPSVWNTGASAGLKHQSSVISLTTWSARYQ